MATCYNRYSRTYYYCRSSWYDWGRWVVLGVIILAAVFFFYFCSCIANRRRRKAGKNAIPGTAWMPGHGVAQYNPNYQAQQSYQPPPTYQPQQQTGGYYNPQSTGQTGQGANASYFGGQRDVEMNAPENAYRGGDNVYAPPTGPPPGKK